MDQALIVDVAIKRLECNGYAHENMGRKCHTVVLQIFGTISIIWAIPEKYVEGGEGESQA